MLIAFKRIIDIDDTSTSDLLSELFSPDDIDKSANDPDYSRPLNLTSNKRRIPFPDNLVAILSAQALMLLAHLKLNTPECTLVQRIQSWILSRPSCFAYADPVHPLNRWVARLLVPIIAPVNWQCQEMGLEEVVLTVLVFVLAQASLLGYLRALDGDKKVKVCECEGIDSSDEDDSIRCVKIPELDSVGGEKLKDGQSENGAKKCEGVEMVKDKGANSKEKENEVAKMKVEDNKTGRKEKKVETDSDDEEEVKKAKCEKSGKKVNKEESESDDEDEDEEEKFEVVEKRERMKENKEKKEDSDSNLEEEKIELPTKEREARQEYKEREGGDEQ